MTRRSLAIAALATLVLAGAAVAQDMIKQKPAVPPLTVENAKIDLGVVKAGSDAEAVFTFHNSSDQPIKIIKAKPS